MFENEEIKTNLTSWQVPQTPLKTIKSDQPDQTTNHINLLYSGHLVFIINKDNERIISYFINTVRIS